MDEHILWCLGAALMMEWNTIPRKLPIVSFLIQLVRWVTYYKQSHSEARLLATYIVTRTKWRPQMAFPSLR